MAEGYYSVDYGDYHLAHHDSCYYFNYFEFNGKKYPVGSFVTLSRRGEFDMDHGHNYVHGGFRLVSHYVTAKGREEWEYIIGNLNSPKFPVFHTTGARPEELITGVLAEEIDEDVYYIGELQVVFEEPNLQIMDWEVEGVMSGWAICIVACILVTIFQDPIRACLWFIICRCFYLYRKEARNKAISEEKSKRRGKPVLLEKIRN